MKKIIGTVLILMLLGNIALCVTNHHQIIELEKGQADNLELLKGTTDNISGILVVCSEFSELHLTTVKCIEEISKLLELIVDDLYVEKENDEENIR